MWCDSIFGPFHVDGQRVVVVTPSTTDIATQWNHLLRSRRRGSRLRVGRCGNVQRLGKAFQTMGSLVWSSMKAMLGRRRTMGFGVGIQLFVFEVFSGVPALSVAC